MSLAHSLLAATYPLLRCSRNIVRSKRFFRPNRLRVLIYHDIAPWEHEAFARQLRWFSRRWSFVSPERFGTMMTEKKSIEGDHLLLTFDDGFASNRVVAETILNPMGIRAIFFVVSEFAAITDRNNARRFIGRHIQPGTAPRKMSEHLYNCGWGDLEALLNQGHTIGGHTRTHARLSQITSREMLEDEIIGGADTIEKKLGCRVEHFAYTFGNFSSLSIEAFEVAKRRFNFLYSGLRGNNAFGVSPLALRRDSLKPGDSTALAGAFLESGADLIYRKQASVLDQWATETG